MYYSAIGLIAIVLHVILNHNFIKWDRNRDEAGKAYERFLLASLLYFVTDALWGILNSLGYLRCYMRILLPIIYLWR